MAILTVLNSSTRYAIARPLLTTQAATVTAVSSARAALDILMQGPLDVLVSDIEMPGTDGYFDAPRLASYQRPPFAGITQR